MMTSFLLMSSCSSKLVKSWNEYSREINHEPKKISNDKFTRMERNLTEDEDSNKELKIEPKITGEVFLVQIYAVLRDEIKGELGIIPETDSQENTMLFIRKNTTILEVQLSLIEADEIHEQMVEIKMTNAVIDFELKIEKTKLKDYVQQYLFFYIRKVLFMVRQTIFNMDDIRNDFKQTLGYITDAYGGESTIVLTNYRGQKVNPFEKAERRLQLSQDNDYMDRHLKRKPVWGKFRLKDIDLKNKKFISKKPGLANYIQSLEPERKLKVATPLERNLKLDPLPVLEITDPRFVYPKNTSFKAGIFHHPVFKDYVKVACNIDRPLKDDGSYISYMLFTGRPNLSDAKVTMKFTSVNNPIIFYFESPSVVLIIVVTVPSSRFTIKHFRVGMEVFVGLLKIVDHLNDLRVWTDFYSNTRKYHYMIKEMIQPGVLTLMYREVFDNLTDGQTAMPDDGQSDHLTILDQYDGGATATLLVKEGQKGVLAAKIDIEEFGEGFGVIIMQSKLVADNLIINLGRRTVPDYSMFNQHYLLKKYIDFQVELVVRGSPTFIDYKEDITPFISKAFEYKMVDDIPELAKPDPGIPLIGYKHSKDVVGAEKLEPFEFGDKITYQLCPVLSTQYHDTILLKDGKYVYNGGRFFLRKDIDYCYAVINHMNMIKSNSGEEGQEERRLLEENVSGHLV